MWSIPTIDTARGIAFLPLTSPSHDYYGGDRKGAGLFGDSLVAVDALTGKRLWHFQTVHHNLWDYDIPAQPTLVTVRHEGKLIDAKGVEARYVRLVSNGSDKTPANHYIEVEVFGRPLR